MREESRSKLWDYELVAEFFRMLDKRNQVA
jgi:hypothetical protein